jgi:prolyl-tRNA synthetase
VRKEAERLYKELKAKNIEVLYDDREDASAGEKFADADLIGIPIRVVVSEKSLKVEGVEVKKRSEMKTKIVSASELSSRLK